MAVACAEAMAKFTPLPSHRAPSDAAEPGHATARVVCPGDELLMSRAFYCSRCVVLRTRGSVTGQSRGVKRRKMYLRPGHPWQNSCMIRLAAVADLHAGRDARESMASHFANLAADADLLLLPGDMTRSGHPDEAEALAGVLQGCGVPVVAVLGNVDFDAEQAPAIVAIMREAGVHMLDRSSLVLDIADERVAIAGVKGFGGGFGAALAEVSGEPQMRAWVQYAEDEAEALEDVLTSMVGDIRLALLHYSPITDTIAGERLERYAFAGNSMLGAAIDRAGVDLVLHGHIHRGSPAGRTPGGIPVRNVAQQVIREPYALFTIERADELPLRERRRWRRSRRDAAGLPWRRRRQRPLNAEGDQEDSTGAVE